MLKDTRKLLKRLVEKSQPAVYYKPNWNMSGSAIWVDLDGCEERKLRVTIEANGDYEVRCIKGDQSWVVDASSREKVTGLAVRQDKLDRALIIGLAQIAKERALQLYAEDVEYFVS